MSALQEKNKYLSNWLCFFELHIRFIKRTKTLSAMSFGAYDVEKRTRKSSFYAQVDTIIDWKTISVIQLVEMLCFEYALIKNKIKLKKAKKRLILIKIARKKWEKHIKNIFFLKKSSEH